MVPIPGTFDVELDHVLALLLRRHDMLPAKRLTQTGSARLTDAEVVGLYGPGSIAAIEPAEESDDERSR